MWIQRSWSCVELLAFLSTVQIAAGPSYALAVALDGSLYTFGSGSNFCLGHGEQLNEFHPRAILSFKRKGIHLLRVSAGDEHVVALDSNGYVYTWGKGYCGALGHGNETDKTTPEPGGKGYCGALGHGNETDKTTPELVDSLKSHLAIQVCPSKRKTFVVVDNGLRSHRISQISTALYHTIVITNWGQLFGFGDNERAQLGQDTLRGCLNPTEILVPKSS